MRAWLWRTLGAALWLGFPVVLLQAQHPGASGQPQVTPPSHGTPAHGSAGTHGHSGHHEEVEAEFAASDIFRTATLIVPVVSHVVFEGHYFSSHGAHVGYTGGAWNFRRRGLLLAPGFGATFGGGAGTFPVAAFRWDFRRRWFVTQGMMLQGLTHVTFEPDQDSSGSEHPASENGHHSEVEKVRPMLSDGSHVSVRHWRVTLGGTWEHIQFREGEEWKGGGRLQFRILPRVSAVLYVLGPGRAEFRGGILFHEREEE